MADLTLAQLQALVEQQGAELAKLKAAAAATTPAPTEYYTLTKTGEEIDEILAGGGGVNDAVRYGEPQSLTDTQKTQARSNIGAAPDGYGLGEYATQLPGRSCNEATRNGWYINQGADAENCPKMGASILSYGTLFVSAKSYTNVAQFYFPAISNFTGYCIRTFDGTTWTPWEWPAPPMALGVEYRTTERYFEKPVYVKIVDCGLIADDKKVAHGISNMNGCLSFMGVRAGAPMPQIYNHSLNDVWTSYVVAVDTTNITLACGSSSAGSNCHVMLKYTKTTD